MAKLTFAVEPKHVAMMEKYHEVDWAAVMMTTIAEEVRIAGVARRIRGAIDEARIREIAASIVAGGRSVPRAAPKPKASNKGRSKP